MDILMPAIMAAGREIRIPVEDRHDTATQSAGSFSWVQQLIEIKEPFFWDKVGYKSLGAGNYTCTVYDDGLNVIEAVGPVAGGAVGTWIAFEISAAIEVSAAEQYYVRFDHPSSLQIYRATSLYNGTLWKAITLAGEGFSGQSYTLAMEIAGYTTS